MKLVLKRRDSLGLRLADRLQDYWRDSAFIADNHKICGVEVRPLTLRMLNELGAVRSPFIVGGVAGPQHIGQFIWRLSPQYEQRHMGFVPTGPERAEAEALKIQLAELRADAGEPPAPADIEALEKAIKNLTQPTVRSRFMASIRQLPYEPTLRAITRFIDRMLYDSPPQTEGGSSTKCDVSFAASIINFIAKTYGWSADQILDTPMPALFQYVRCIQRDADPGLMTFNPLRDRFNQRLVDKRNAAVLAARNKTEVSSQTSDVSNPGSTPVSGVGFGVPPKQSSPPPTHLDCIDTDGCKAATETSQPS